MVGEISGVTRTEVLRAIRNRYREASKKDKSRMYERRRHNVPRRRIDKPNAAV